MGQQSQHVCHGPSLFRIISYPVRMRYAAAPQAIGHSTGAGVQSGKQTKISLSIKRAERFAATVARITAC
jgi:hypothetical protein